MNMRFLIAAVSLATLLISVNAAEAAKRVAFVVGNGAYKNVAALPNPAMDAKSMAKLRAMSASTSWKAPTSPATR
jgi:hypothetical protein